MRTWLPVSVLVTKTARKKLGDTGIHIQEDLTQSFDDCGCVPSVQYVTGMKLFSRRWDDRQVIGGKFVC